MKTKPWELVHVDAIEKVWMQEVFAEDDEDGTDFIENVFYSYKGSEFEVHMRSQKYCFVLKREKVKQGDFKNKPSSTKKHK